MGNICIRDGGCQPNLHTEESTVGPFDNNVHFVSFAHSSHVVDSRLGSLGIDAYRLDDKTFKKMTQQVTIPWNIVHGRRSFQKGPCVYTKQSGRKCRVGGLMLGRSCQS